MKVSVTQIVADVFLLPPDTVRPDLRREEVDTWDSLNHLRLVTAIEEAFQIQLSMQEIQSINGIARLEEIVSERMSDQ